MALSKKLDLQQKNTGLPDPLMQDQMQSGKSTVPAFPIKQKSCSTGETAVKKKVCSYRGLPLRRPGPAGNLWPLFLRGKILPRECDPVSAYEKRHAARRSAFSLS